MGYFQVRYNSRVVIYERKMFTIYVIYDSRVVWLENCLYYDSSVVIYAHKMFIRLAIGAQILAL